MGMIHDVTITDDTATIELTYPCLGCPAYEFIQADIADHARTVDGIASVEIDIVWDPPWSKQRLSPETREKIRAAGIDL